jgi:hypothetical protein
MRLAECDVVLSFLCYRNNKRAEKVKDAEFCDENDIALEPGC